MQNNEKGPQSHRKIKCSFLMDHQKTVRRLPEDQQETARRLPEDHQKPLAVFWQSSNTMIQGNFYKKITLLDGQLCHRPYGFLVCGIH